MGGGGRRVSSSHWTISVYIPQSVSNRERGRWEDVKPKWVDTREYQRELKVMSYLHLCHGMLCGVHCTENLIFIFLEMKPRGLVPKSYIHVSVSNLYILRIGRPIWLQQSRQTDPGNI